MKAKASLGVLALTILIAGCGDGGEGNLAAAAANQTAPLPQIPAPNNGDWTQNVVQTEGGGFLMGNPDAPVKLLEYASMTCPACAAFTQQSSEPLKNTYVRSGQVSYELRPLVIGGAPDAAVWLLARCLSPSAFFPTVEQIYARQSEWLGRATPEVQQRILALPQDQQLAAWARALEMDTFFARRGMPESQFNQCLSDTSGVNRLVEVSQAGQSQYNLQGTPSFVINNEPRNISSWQEVEGALRSAIPQ